MAAPKPNANGHRRRELMRRVWAEESTCALCGEWVDPSLKITPGAHGKKCPGGACPGCIPHPRRGEVDEDIPRSRGGSPYERKNCHLMHRACNQAKGTRTLAEALRHRQGLSNPKQQVTASPIW